MRLRTLLVPVAAMSFAASLPALASTPESGTVSKDSPSVKWEGSAAGYGVIPVNLLLEAGGQGPAPCEAPACDSFALKVTDKYDLDVVATSRSGTAVEMHVVKPDGETIVARDAESDKVKIRVKGAAPGDYTVEVLTNDTAEAGGYDATATLVTGAAAPGGTTPSGGPPPPNPGTPPSTEPQPQPQPGSPPASQPQPAASLGLKTKKLSARKAKRRFKLVVTSSKPVTDFKMVVKKGKKIVSRGKLKTLSGKAAVKLKVKRKLKRGTYTVAMTAKDGAQTVGLVTKLKVAR